MEPVGKSWSLLIIVTTLLSETWGAPDKELLCGGKLLKATWQWHLCTYQCQARGGGGGGVGRRVRILTSSNKKYQNLPPKLAETNGLLLFCYIKLKV